MRRNFFPTSLAALAVFCACQSSPPKVVQVAPSGKQVSMQFSRDTRSLVSRQPAKEALEAREQLASRKDLTDAMLTTVAELSLIAGRPDEAATQARAVLKKDFKNVEALRTLVKVAIFTRKYQEAILLAENALQVQPREPDILCLKGLAHYFQDDVFAAKSLWKKAVEVNPTHITALMDLATLYFHNRNISAAGAGYEKVLALQPGNLDAQVGKALVMSMQGNSAEGKRLLEQSLAQSPKSPLVLYNLAMIERDRFENYEASLDYIDRYLQEAQKERANVERAIAQREELRALIAKKKSQKLSDAELRKLASKSSQAAAISSSSGGDTAVPEEIQQAPESAPAPAPTAPPAKAAAPQRAPAQKPPTREPPKPTPKPDDAQSLEDAIK